MLATNSALTLGMHHSFFCQGLRAFFETLAHPFVGHGRCQLQLHHLVSQQAQGPVVMPCRRRAAGQGDQSLPRTGYGWASPPVVQLPVPVGLGTVLQHPANPSSVKRCLTRYTVPRATSKASATWGAGQPSSLLRRTRALAVTRGRVFPNPNQTLEFFPLFRYHRTAYLSLTITATPAINTSHQAGYPIVRFLK